MLKKVIIVASLLLLLIAVILVYCIKECRIQEVIIDKWDPITPSVLEPYNQTGWAFAVLTSNGTYLELNISASGRVRIIIGKLVYFNEITRERIYSNVVFNETGTRFIRKVEIAEKDVDFLEIENRETYPVEISGNINKTGNVHQQFYPYSSIGTLIGLVGLSLLVYGIVAKANKKKKRKRAQNCFWACFCVRRRTPGPTSPNTIQKTPSIKWTWQLKSLSPLRFVCLKPQIWSF